MSIKGTHIDEIMDFIAGSANKKPAGADLLLNRMKDEKYFKEAIKLTDEHRQRGEGFAKHNKSKKQLQLYKTKGLIRKMPNKFQPLIWAKL
jgi:hypothetical protein